MAWASLYTNYFGSNRIDYEYDFSQTDIADQSDDDVCPIQDYNTHLYTETGKYSTGSALNTNMDFYS